MLGVGVDATAGESALIVTDPPRLILDLGETSPSDGVVTCCVHPRQQRLRMDTVQKRWDVGG
jgi:hypothetical protein